MPTIFKNEPFTDFTKPANIKGMKKALAKILKTLGAEHPIVIGGKKYTTAEKLYSYNPSRPAEVIGIFQKANIDLANKAVEEASKAFETWKNVPVKKRADYLFKAAALMRKRKFEFSSMLTYEVGKSWAEADADTAEAIDFLEFYGREMLRLAAPQPLTKVAGEKNELRYIPLGVGLCVPPWNFALAILAGMTTAAVVAGNTVVLKPSSDSPGVGYMFFELMEEVGLPKGVINFITGPGFSLFLLLGIFGGST